MVGNCNNLAPNSTVRKTITVSPSSSSGFRRFFISGDTMKTCYICKEKKPESEMHVSHKSYCKKCRKEHARKWHIKNRDRILSQKREYYQKNKDKETERNRRRRNTVATLASRKLERYVYKGKIIKPNKCSVCGRICNPHGHHDDYSKPLDVKWVCSFCHADIHWPLA